MSRLRQYALPRQNDRARRGPLTWSPRPATKHLVAAASVALAVLPLSACSDGGGSIIRSWLLKQDGVEKVDVTHANCTPLDGSYCITRATISLSPDLSPDAVCSLAHKADEELPKNKRIDSYSTALTFTWNYHGTELKLEHPDIPIKSTGDTDRDPSRGCRMLNIAAEYAGDEVDEITVSSLQLKIHRGDVDEVPDNLFIRTPSPEEKLETESWDNFTLNDWSTTVTASSATAASEAETKKLLTDISRTPGPSDRSRLHIFLQLGGTEGDSPASEISVGGLGGSSFSGPDVDVAAPVLAAAMKHPEISTIKLCPTNKKGSSLDNCLTYHKEQGSFDDDDRPDGRSRDIYEAAKKLP